MNRLASRRRFLWHTAATGVFCGLGDLSFLSRLPVVSAAEARLPAGAVSLRPEIAPLVRLLEATPRARLLEEVGHLTSALAAITAILGLWPAR